MWKKTVVAQCEVGLLSQNLPLATEKYPPPTIQKSDQI
jgi:hypothetical protein